MRILASFIIISTIALGQFGKVEVTIDDRLLRNNERQKVSSIGYEITRFFSGQIWDEDSQDLKIPLHISIAFQGIAQKSGMETFHAQVLI